MTASVLRQPRVVHLDHTSVAGGAEFSLVRMLLADPTWTPAVLLPPTSGVGVFAPLEGRVPLRIAGVAQPAGVSAGGIASSLGAGARLVAHAALTRVDSRYRSADLIAANTARSAAYGALAALTSRAPFVVHLRDLVDREALGGLGFRVLTRIALPRANGVVANSRATLDSAMPYLRPDAAAAVIPSAAGLRPVRPGSSRAAGGPADDGVLRIGMLARIDPWKGQHLLLEAFAQAFGEDDHVQLELPGDPLFGHEEHLTALRSRAGRLGVGDRVSFPGHVDATHALGRWDVAVQYSTRPEPLGQNVLQYLAAGCVTVVADEGGPREWVTDGVNGICVPPRDVAALAGTLRRLADDPTLRVRLASEAPATPGLLDDGAVAEAHGRFYAEVARGDG